MLKIILSIKQRQLLVAMLLVGDKAAALTGLGVGLRHDY